jgi:PEGA domain
MVRPANKKRALVGVVVVIIFCLAATAQVRPTIVDSGDVESKPSARVDRSRVGNTKPSRPSLGVIIVLTEPKDAEVSINGEPAVKAANGRFRTELPTRKQYKIKVSAGPDYGETNRVVSLKRGEPAIVEAPLPSKFGILRIFPAKEGVTLKDNDQPIAETKLSVDEDKRIVIERLTPGEHTITYDLPGYVLYRRTFNIKSGNEYIWNFIPDRAVTELTVITDPKAIVYVDGKQVGMTPADGTLKQTVELGPHEVKLVKEDFEEYKTTREFEYGKPEKIDQKLVPLPTSAEFSDDFDIPKPNLWTMPASGFTIKDGRLHVENAKSLASPTNIRYRNFEMSFHLKLANSGGAAWAVRVKDLNNYYLFYLSGPGGLSPNRFYTYIVRNGEFDPKQPVRSDNVIARLTSEGQYQIVITATGNRIEHQIIPAESGKAENLGFFEDPNSTFLLGGIGFRTVASERFSIDELVIKPR